MSGQGIQINFLVKIFFDKMRHNGDNLFGRIALRNVCGDFLLEKIRLRFQGDFNFR
jgi:hypothetical protein